MIYEVFLMKEGREYRHAGSLEAPSDELAGLLAREAYARRAEGTRLWLVPREHVVVVGEDLVGPNENKPHRHHDGAAVAALRKQARTESK